MGRTAGRSAGDTRRKLVAAAGSVIQHHGVAATLDDIALAAGVSKGGLIYHFGSKEELLRAVGVSLIESFRAAVDAVVDPSETSPGKLTRAYIRASLDTSIHEREIVDYVGLTAQLLTSPPVAELIRLDSERWGAELRQDGLPDDILTLVVAAADGASLAPMWGGLAGFERFDHLREQLIALTLVPRP